MQTDCYCFLHPALWWVVRLRDKILCGTGETSNRLCISYKMHPSNRLCIKKKGLTTLNGSPVSIACEAILLVHSDLVKSESAEIL